MSTKLKIFYVVVFITVIVMICIITYYLSHESNNNQQITPTPVNIQSTLVSPTLPPQQSLDSVVNRIQNKKPLNQNDQAIKDSLIKKIDQNGILKSTNEYNIYYVNSADVFRVQIKTWAVTPAINDAITWFRSLGLSDQGICNLPVVIYRDPKEFDPTLTAGMEFYPLPFTCQ